MGMNLFREGFALGKRGGPIQWTREKIEAAFAAFVETNGRLPVAREMKPQNGLPTRRTFETKMRVTAQEYAERHYPQLLAQRNVRHKHHVRQYYSERQAWSVERLVEAEKIFFQRHGRLPAASEYRAENGLPMYSVFCALAKEAFERDLEMTFQEELVRMEESGEWEPETPENEPAPDLTF